MAVRGKHARWFFVLYYVLGVVVALNIVVAFVLDAYSSIEAAQQQEQQQAGRGEGGAAWVGDHLILDAGRVSGTSTGLTGEIEVSLDPSLSVSLTESRRAMLAALFTHRAPDNAPDGPEAATRPAGPLGGGPPGGGPQLARGASWKQQLVKAFSLRRAERDGAQGGTQGAREGPSYTPPEPAAAPPTAPGRISRGASFGEAMLGLAQAAAGATALAAVGTTHEVAGDADK